jgi:hypothetical protein
MVACCLKGDAASWDKVVVSDRHFERQLYDADLPL